MNKASKPKTLCDEHINLSSELACRCQAFPKCLIPRDKLGNFALKMTM